MHKGIIALFCSAACCFASAVPVFTCTTPTLTLSGSTACSVQRPNGGVLVTTDGTYSIPEPSGLSNSFLAQTHFDAYAAPDPYAWSTASITLEWSFNAITSGPERAGIILLDLGVSPTSSGRNNSAVSIAQYQCGKGRGNCGNFGSVPFAFTLGVPFTISISDSVYTDSDWSLVQAYSELGFSLFEADGTTPVAFLAATQTQQALAQTPEPGMLLPLLAVFALSLLLRMDCVRKQCSQPPSQPQEGHEDR